LARFSLVQHYEIRGGAWLTSTGKQPHPLLAN